MITASRTAVLHKLRPPYTQPVKVVYAFSRTEPANWGHVLAVGKGQPLVAAGDGVVDKIDYLESKWHTDAGVVRCLAIRIDHGSGIKTWLHGFATSLVGHGPVTRGQLLGYACQDRVFFGVESAGQLQDPASINQHFGLLDGWLNYQKGANLRQAPDVLERTRTTVRSLLWKGLRHFVPARPTPVRFNLDFNGGNDKAGSAVVGAFKDVWQSIPALDYAPVYNYYGTYNDYCADGALHQGKMGFFLHDYRGTQTKVYFERGVMTSAAGHSDFFDPMLSSWVGGYTGIIPVLNSFTIRNLPSGTYALYLYSNGGTTTDVTTFYVSVNHGSYQAKTCVPTTTAAWEENENYAKFSPLAVPTAGDISVVAHGYLAGLQLDRA